MRKSGSSQHIMWKWVAPSWAADKRPWCCFLFGSLCCCCTSPSRWKHCFAEGEDGVLLMRARDLRRFPRYTSGRTVATCIENYNIEVGKYHFFLIFSTDVHITSYASKRWWRLQAEKILAINLRWISSGLDRVGSGNQWSIECTPSLRGQPSECTVRTSLPTEYSVVFTSIAEGVYMPCNEMGIPTF